MSYMKDQTISLDSNRDITRIKSDRAAAREALRQSGTTPSVFSSRQEVRSKFNPGEAKKDFANDIIRQQQETAYQQPPGTIRVKSRRHHTREPFSSDFQK